MDIVLANPRGFCAGVDRAIDIVNRALEVFGGPVYVRHEVVHNRHVVDDLRTRGAVFVDELSEVPDDAIVIFESVSFPLDSSMGRPGLTKTSYLCTEDSLSSISISKLFLLLA